MTRTTRRSPIAVPDRRARTRTSFPALFLVVLTVACGDVDEAVVGAGSPASLTAALPARGGFEQTDLALASGYAGGVARAVNARGTIAGWAVSPARGVQGVLWDGGRMIALPGLGGVSSAAEVINARGDVAGWAETASGAAHAVVWRRGAPVDLGTLGGSISVANGINDRGDVVGVSETASGEFNAFLWSRGVMTNLGKLPGARVGWAEDINNRGDVVGWSSVPIQSATLWRDGEIIGLGTLGSESSAAAINERGVVVGASIPLDGSFAHAVLWDGDGPVDLGFLAGDFSSASGINERGHVVGVTGTPDCFSCPFVWEKGVMTPLPVNDFVDIASATDISNSGIIVGNTTDLGATAWTPSNGRSASAAIVASAARTAPRASRKQVRPSWGAQVCRMQGPIRDPGSALLVAAGC